MISVFSVFKYKNNIFRLILFLRRYCFLSVLLCENCFVKLCVIAIRQKIQKENAKITNKQFTDVHKAQVLTYLKLDYYKRGLLLNFQVTTLKNDLKVVVN